MRILIYSILLSLIGITSVLANGDKDGEYTKVIKKEFSVSSTDLVNIENSHGDVFIRTWPQNSVNIEVTITVSAKSEEQAQERFTYFEIEFEKGSDYVAAETEIKSWNKKRNYFPWKWNKYGEDEYSIDYVVYMPATNGLDLDLKYGDAEIPKMSSDVAIQISYGMVEAEEISGELHLDLKYGEGSFESASDADLEVAYSQLALHSAEMIDLESRYSQINIGSAKEIRSESRYDKYTVGKLIVFENEGRYDGFNIEALSEAEVDGNFSDYKIGELSTSGNFDMRYGKVHIQNVLDGFHEIHFDGEHAGFNLTTEPGDSYQLDIQSNYASVRYPENIYKSNIKEEHNSLSFVGTIGSEQSPQSKVVVRMKYGGLEIK